MTSFNLQTKSEDYVGEVDCEPSKVFDNIFFNIQEHKIYIMDDSTHITYAITIPTQN